MSVSSAEAPAPPDYSGIAAASEASAKYAYDLGKEQLAWAKEQWAANKDVSDLVIDAALGRLDSQDANAKADRDRYETIFQPLEEQLAQEAQDYSTPQKQEEQAGRAEADVAQQFEQARRTAQEKLESFGVDPSQTRAGALDLQSRVAEAASQAGAGNQARQNVDAVGRALRSEAINVGKGYPGQIAGQYGVAMNSANQGVNSGLATTASGANTMGTAPQYQQLGNSALGTWGNTLNMGYQNQLDAFKANQASSSGLGSVLGLGASLLGGLFAEGGAVPDGPPNAATHSGIPVLPQQSPTGGAVPDDVDAKLNVGEFIVPKDVTAWNGEKFFQDLIQKSRQQKMGAAAKPQAGGQPAGPPAIQTAVPV